MKPKSEWKRRRRGSDARPGRKTGASGNRKQTQKRSIVKEKQRRIKTGLNTQMRPNLLAFGKSRKIKENHRKSSKIKEKSWKIKENHGKSAKKTWKIMETQGKTWKIMENSQGKSWKIMENPGKIQEKSWKSWKILENPGKSNGY